MVPVVQEGVVLSVYCQEESRKRGLRLWKLNLVTWHQGSLSASPITQSHKTSKVQFYKSWFSFLSEIFPIDFGQFWMDSLDSDLGSHARNSLISVISSPLEN